MMIEPIKIALKIHKKSFIQVALFSALINILMLAPAIYMLQVYDRVLSSGNPYTLLMLTVLLVSIFILLGFMEWIRSSVLINISEDFDQQLNSRVVEASFNYQRLSGQAYPSQAISDLNKVRQFLTGSACFAFFDAPWAPLYLLVLYLFHPVLGSLALIGCILLCVLAYINEKWGKQSLQSSSRANSEGASVLDDYVQQADSVYAMGMLKRLQSRWYQIHRSMIFYQGDASRRSGLITAISKSLRIALQSLMLGAGAWLAINNHITAGTMVAGSILIGRMLSPIEQLVAAWKQWTGVRLAQERLTLLLNKFPEEQDKLALPKPEGKLTIEGLSFYSSQGKKNILKNINFSTEPADVVGVIGPSGSGKSTLVKLMTGIWQPQVGKVRIDGADIEQWQQDELGTYLGYLPQEVSLLPGTIAENISRFLTDQGDEEVIIAARLAGVHDLILNFEDGYNTRIGAGGCGLSGGEKQRIGLAQAVYGDPKVVILDEPNSNLDDRGEVQLTLAIRALQKKNITVVFVTHKMKILELTNKLLVMDEGQIKLFGPTQQVLKTMQSARQQSISSLSA